MSRIQTPHKPARGNAKHQAAAGRTTDRVLELHDDIHRQLVTIVELDRVLADDLAGTHQPTGLGFQTTAARAAANQRAAADRAAAHGRTGQITTTGQRWLNATDQLSAGATPAPVNLPAVSMSAEILFTLRHHVRRLSPPALEVAIRTETGRVLTALEDELRGWCDWPPSTAATTPHPLLVDPPSTDGDVVDTARDLARLVEHYTHRRGLEALLRDLDHLEDKARDLVYGPAKTNHDQPCPWCGRTTLVVHHREAGRDVQGIRCEGDHRCECTWEWCDCHRNPHRNRHEWINSGRAAHSWTELMNLQTKRKELSLLETKALDAVGRIRALHQPTWTVAGVGEPVPAYVYLTGDGDNPLPFPADHECVDDREYDGHGLVDGCHDEGEFMMHAVPVCTTCGTAGVVGDLDEAVPWPCPTYLATDLDRPGDSNEE